MTPAKNVPPQENQTATSPLLKRHRRGQRIALASAALCLALAPLVSCGGDDAPQVSQTNKPAPPAAAASPQTTAAKTDEKSATQPNGTGIAPQPPTRQPATQQTPPPAAPPTPAQLITPPAVVMTTDLKTLDGKRLRLANLKGKVVVLDLWATWCGPCRVEIPHLIALGDEYKKRGVEVVGLTIEDPLRDAAKVKKFADDFKINYKLGWSPNEVSLGLMGKQTNIPQTFIFTRDGRIFKRFIGFNPQTTPPQMRDAIEQALTAAS